MNIGFDISPLSSGHAGRGTGTYTKQLFEALQQNSSITLISFKELIPEDVDLVHYPYFDLFFLTLPRNQQKPFVVTVHDFIPLLYKKHFPPGLRGKIKWMLQKKSLLKAQAIITDSNASKKDIVDLLGINVSKVHVVYLAPGAEFKPQTEQEKIAIRKKYHLPERFLLYVGDVNWNKNIPRLIEAITTIDVPLVLVGKAFLNDTLPEVEIINETIKKYNLSNKVKVLGFVPREDLPKVYSAASLCVQVSIAEGFGLPVLESMATGTPCVVSSNSSLIEIAGPSVLVNPLDVDDISRGISDGLKRTWNTNDLLKWSSQFTWKNTAEQTIQVYEKVLKGINV